MYWAHGVGGQTTLVRQLCCKWKDLFPTLQFDNMTTAELLWRKIYKQGGKRKRMQRGEDSTMYKSKYSAIVIKQ